MNEHRCYLTPRQAAAYLGLSVWSLYRLVAGRAISYIPIRTHRPLPGKRSRSRIRFDVTALDMWMKKRTVRALGDLDPRPGNSL